MSVASAYENYARFDSIWSPKRHGRARTSGIRSSVIGGNMHELVKRLEELTDLADYLRVPDSYEDELQLLQKGLRELLEDARRLA